MYSRYALVIIAGLALFGLVCVWQVGFGGDRDAPGQAAEPTTSGPQMTPQVPLEDGQDPAVSSVRPEAGKDPAVALEGGPAEARKGDDKLAKKKGRDAGPVTTAAKDAHPERLRAERPLEHLKSIEYLSNHKVVSDYFKDGAGPSPHLMNDLGYLHSTLVSTENSPASDEQVGDLIRLAALREAASAAQQRWNTVCEQIAARQEPVPTAIVQATRRDLLTKLRVLKTFCQSRFSDQFYAVLFGAPPVSLPGN